MPGGGLSGGFTQKSAHCIKVQRARRVPGGTQINRQRAGAVLRIPDRKIRTESPLGRIVLLQEICGFVVAENGRDAAGKQIHEYLIGTGLSDWQDQWMMNEKALW